MKLNSLKSLIATFSVFIAGICAAPGIANARSVDRTPIIATLTGSENGVASVSFLADGRLLIVKKDQAGVQIEQLPPTAATRLTRLAYQLEGAPLKKTRRESVCRTVAAIRPTLIDLQVSKYDPATQEFTSDMRLVQTGEGCYYLNEVTPKGVAERASALQLRTALAVLAVTLVK